MKKILLALIFVLLVFDFSFSGEKKDTLKKAKRVDVEVQAIEIKELRIGMTKAEFESVVGGELPHRHVGESGIYSYIGKLPQFFSIARVFSINYEFNLEFREDKLDLFYFNFNSNEFDILCEAIIEKYPSIKCKESIVTNARGGTFNQTSCALEDQISSLSISRFVGDINTSAFMLQSKRRMLENNAEREKKRKTFSLSNVNRWS